MGVQNRDYIFTENFLNDFQKYNMNITKTLKEFIGIDTNYKEDETNSENQVPSEVEPIEETTTEEIVPNLEGNASSINQMEEDIGKVKELVLMQKPINEGTITSRFGTRESNNKNVDGYHTGIDIGAVKRNSYMFSNFAVK